MPDNSSDNKLELSISTEKNTYYINEPIYLVARLTNTGSVPLPVPPPRIEPSGIPSNIGLSVKSSRGETLQPVSREKTGGIEISPRGDDLTTLNPGKSWVVVVDMLAAYGTGQDLGNMVFRRGRLDKGEYTIEAFYRASLAESGIMKSNPLNVSVRRTPTCELPAMKKLFKAHHLYRSEQPEEARQKALRIYRKVIRKYPTSRYLSDAYRMLVELSRGEKAGSIKKAVYDSQSKFADPVFLYNVAMHLEETAVMDRNILIDLLRKLYWRAPGTTFSEVIRQRLIFEEIVSRSLNKDEKGEAASGQSATSEEKQH
jgi:hypothetical protein